jgi:ribosomal protein S19
MTEKLRGVLANAQECKSNKKVDRDRVRQMSRERMERPDTVGKLRSVYNERPNTAASKGMSKH